MDEVSNRTLAVLLVVAVVVSLGGTLISLERLSRIDVPVFSGITGFASSTGNITFTVSELVEINLSTLDINFGSGNYDSVAAQGADKYCQLATFKWEDGPGPTPTTFDQVGPNCTGFTAPGGFSNQGINITNTGNVNVTLNMSCNHNAQTLIGGGGSASIADALQFNLSDETEEGSCATADGIVDGGFLNCATNLSEPLTGALLCGNFGSQGSNNQLDMQWRFLIPSDAHTDTGANESLAFQLVFVKNITA